jgi:hypothetical protein
MGQLVGVGGSRDARRQAFLGRGALTGYDRGVLRPFRAAAAPDALAG